MSLTSSCFKMDGMDLKITPWQFKSVMLGEYSSQGVSNFWRHVKTLDAWKHHAVIHKLTDDELSHMIPCNIHGDGAEMFTDDEYFVWSWSSAFSSASLTSDVLLHRFPKAVVAEREMLDDTVFWQSIE